MAEYPALDLRFLPGGDATVLEDRLYAALDDFQPIAIQEHETADGWLVFFRTPATRDAAAAALGAFDDDRLGSVTPLSIPDDDWARRSQASLTAITVGRITVAPPWDPLAESSAPRGLEPAVPARLDADVARPGSLPSSPGPRVQNRLSIPHPGFRIPDPVERQIVIVIDPSMGFGTGHHQTTRLCLRLLQSEAVTGGRVVDVGTGSGVLAIAAWRLGAASVVAMDNDPDAIQNARENIARNDAADAIDVWCAELSDFTAAPADIVTANLTAAVLQRHAESLRRLARPGGVLIVSGFSPEELPGVAAAFDTPVSQSVVEGEWAAATFRL